MQPRYLQAELHHDVYVSDINKDREAEYLKLLGCKQVGDEWYRALRKIVCTLAGQAAEVEMDSTAFIYSLVDYTTMD